MFAALVAIAGVWRSADAAVIVDHPDFASVSGLKLNGTAQRFGDSIRLVEADDGGAASVFTRRSVVRLDRSFASSFRVYATDAKDVANHGYAFVVHGRGEGALGEGDDGLGYEGIRPSVAVEFDFYLDGLAVNDHHVAITKNGDTEDQPRAPFFLAYGSTVRALVKYNAKRHRMELFATQMGPMPSDPLVKRRVNLERLIGRRGRAGFTASATVGGSTQELQSWVLRGSR